MTAEMIPDQEGGRPDPAVPGPGFAAGGPFDTRAPSALLAGLADAATRDGHLAGLTDDELVGVMRTWQRLESWCGAGLLATAITAGASAYKLVSIVGGRDETVQEAGPGQGWAAGADQADAWSAAPPAPGPR